MVRKRALAKKKGLTINKKYNKNITKQTKTNNKKKEAKKMFGGALADLDKIDKSKKTIILMGEWHTHITDSTYMEILSKQKRLIDIVKEKYDRAAMFYSEAPKETATHVMSPSIHSTETIRYVLHIGMALQLSSVARCDRELFGSCDEGYANDIIAAISDPEIHCVLVQIGLDHVPVLKHILETRMERRGFRC